MRNIMHFKENVNADFGVVVTAMPPIPTPAERGELIEIPGRNGGIWKGDGSYLPVTLTVPIWVPPSASLTQVRGWLSGEGALHFNDEEPYWVARVDGETHFAPSPFNDGWATTITFSCQPFRRIDAPDIEVTENPFSVVNPYSAYSEPIITVTCTGDFSLTVNETTCAVSGASGEIVLDTERQECYQGQTLLTGQMAGAFPVLSPGENVITYGGGVSGVRIAPEWRTL